MIKITDRYIAKTVLLSVFLVLLVIISLQTVFVFVEQLGSIRENYQFFQVVEYVLLSIPGTFYEVIPVAALIGCLLGLGSLASTNELVVIRSAGVSLWRIGLSVFKPALIIILSGFLVGEYVVPKTEQYAEIKRNMARSPDGKYADDGVWHREGNDFIFFNSIRSDGVLFGISRYRFDENNRLLEASYAEKGVKQGNGWLLTQVTGTYFEDGLTKSYKLNHKIWDMGLDLYFLKILLSKPEHLSMGGLFTYIKYLSFHELDSGEYRLALWKKLLMPLSIFSLILIGMSFVFGPLRSVNFGLRLFTGVVTGIVFMITQNLMGAVSLVFGIAPFLAVFFPIFACCIIAFHLLKKAA